MSTERERLIELVKESLMKHIDKSCALAENIAEDLFDNGVIVSPVKVGQTVYYPWIYQGQSGIAFSEVESIKIYYNRLPIVMVEDWESDMPMPTSFTIEDFGETVFLSREEAERELERRKNDEQN